jgi:hypothetical protein
MVSTSVVVVVWIAVERSDPVKGPDQGGGYTNICTYRIRGGVIPRSITCRVRQPQKRSLPPSTTDHESLFDR